MNRFDVIVVGGGHAGCEAAHAAARLGCATAMIVTDKLSIARMSCNPAIGGPGKSQIVREIDALGGLMARVTDRAGLQWRTLNSAKGAAVRACRAQADTIEYEAVMREELAVTPNLSIIEGTVKDILGENGAVRGVRLLSGDELEANAVILCTGTFLNGLLHTGLRQTPGGRVGEGPSSHLSASLKNFGLQLGRLKTGTPARLHKDSINWNAAQEQPGDTPPPPMSYFTKRIVRGQLPCHITHTNASTHEIIRTGFARSPLFTGVIQGVGPRYCPSIEDKVVRFPERLSHHIFLEPVSRHNGEIYPNGISTSLPEDIQDAFLRSIPGLEEVRVIRHGYAVEYDFVPPTQTYPTLESKAAGGLYMAGQINGTSGYEEAAGQGILAGINAARKLRREEPVILSRAESYIGVMVDDLTTLGTEEPYRMFTSRAEHRLVMRQDNADQRLCELGRSIGLLAEEPYREYRERQGRIQSLVGRLKGKYINPTPETMTLLSDSGLPPVDVSIGIAQYMKRPDVALKRDSVFGDLSAFDDTDIARAETEIKYEGYIARQNRWIEQLGKIENLPLEKGMDYRGISGLSVELQQKLEKVKPLTFGQASRIAGMTPAALSILMIHLKTRGRDGGH